MSASLVGSEMCIRDRMRRCEAAVPPPQPVPGGRSRAPGRCVVPRMRSCRCLLYTSDAADDM
eukprot:3972593-Alexandrium_andersonii.AAC.1